jgi:hypothetical protein
MLIFLNYVIFDNPLCRSARESFILIAHNAWKVGSITYVSSIVRFVGKFIISCVTTSGVAYICINQEMGDDLYSIGGPCALIFIMSYFVSDIFLDIFDMSTTTILHCFVADEEMFEGDKLNDLTDFVKPS